MKYKITNDVTENISDDLLHKLLNSRGVDDVDHLMNVSERDVHNFNLLDNIIIGCEGYISHIQNGNNVVIVQDSDYDGVSSTSLLYLYTSKNLKYKCDLIVHENKEHGINFEEIKKYGINKIDLLVLPDAGTSDIKQMNQILEVNPNIQFLVLDHHKPTLKKGETIECFLNRNPALIINPETSNYPNHSLSGCAVVYKFCQCLDSFLKINDADNYLDLVATSLIADSMDLRDYESRYLTIKGLQMLDEDSARISRGEDILGNRFLRTIIDSKKERDLKHLTIKSIGWGLAPIINGTIRMGTMEQKTDMVKGFCNIDDGEQRYHQPRRPNGSPKDSPKPDPIPITFLEYVLKQCTSAKSKQDGLVKKYYALLKQRIEDKNLLDNKVLMVDSTDIIPEKTLSGLVANKLSDDYKRPVITLKKRNGSQYGGSGRNYDKSPIKSLRELINDTGLAKSSGHDNANGIFCEKRNLVPLRDYLNEQLKDLVFEDVYHVDYEIPIGRLRKKDVMAVGRLAHLWGNGLPEPLFAITNVNLSVGDISLIGSNKNMLKFKKGDHDFIKYYSGSEELDKMCMRTKKGFGKSPSRITLDLICKMEINEWDNGFEVREYPQLIIVDYNVKEAKKALF